MLPDLLSRHLDLVVIGNGAAAPFTDIARYYASPGDRFWRTLAEVGLTPEELAADEYERLLVFGIGLIDIAHEVGMSKSDVRLSFGDVMMLRLKLMHNQPWYLCFNGKRAAQEFLGVRAVEYGVQRTRYGRTVLFVAPSTSASASGSWDLSFWQDLARRVCRPRGATGRRRRA